MKWMLWILGGLAIIIGIPALVGAMLPVRHHATRRARFRASPAALYAVVAGPPDWRTGVKSFGVLSETSPRRWWEEDNHGQKITFEQVEARPAERLQVRIAQAGLPFSGSWSFDISPSGDGGADLRITEDGEIYNVIFRFLARFVFGYHRSIEQYLRDLGVKFVQTVNIED